MVKTPSRGKTPTTGAVEMIAENVAEIVSRHVRLTVVGSPGCTSTSLYRLQYEQGSSGSSRSIAATAAVGRID